MEIIDSTGFDVVKVLARRPSTPRRARSEHLLQPFEQAGRGPGVAVGEQPGKVLGAT
jgi:hypothetical protein